MTFSLDGRYAYPSTGDVIDTKTRKIVISLKDENGSNVHASMLTPRSDSFGIRRAGASWRLP